MNAEKKPARTPAATTDPVKVYRCKQCNKVLFEARGVKGLSKRCPRCKTVNVYDD